LQKTYNIINAKNREEKRIERGEKKINIIIRRIFTGVCIFIYVYEGIFLIFL
jgi:hypothetical protein